MNITQAAETALIDANNSSGRIPADTAPAVVSELRAAGLIGEQDGMSMRGRIARDRAITRKMEDLF